MSEYRFILRESLSNDRGVQGHLRDAGYSPDCKGGNPTRWRNCLSYTVEVLPDCYFPVDPKTGKIKDLIRFKIPDMNVRFDIGSPIELKQQDIGWSFVDYVPMMMSPVITNGTP